MSVRVYVVKLKSSNWRSVVVAFESAGLVVSSIYISEIFLLEDSAIIVLPGIGNISSLPFEFNSKFNTTDLRKFIFEKSIKVIGICLGFQYMCLGSEEDSEVICLELCKLEVKAIKYPPRPSVGWFKINGTSNIQSDELHKLINNNYFYLTHSFGVIGNNLANEGFDYYHYTTKEGMAILAAVVGKNFIGFQFHPEKSGKVGLDLLYMSVNYLRGG